MACLFGHKWNGCKCTKCGKMRDEGHEWDGCKCKKCGAVRNEGHNLVDGRCTRCGGVTICGLLTNDEITTIVNYFSAYRMLYGRMSNEGDTNDLRSLAGDGAKMYESLENFFSNRDVVRDKATWKIVFDTLTNIRKTLPGVLSESILSIIEKFRDIM